MWDAIASSPIGMGLNLNDTELLAQCNEFISHLADDGGVYERLAAKYDAVIEYALEGQGLSFYIKEDE